MKRITQETFDEVVKENIEEFDMNLEVATKDAIDQFTKQGIDLTNIDTTTGEGRQEVLETIQLIKTLDQHSIEKQKELLTLLESFCNIKHPMYLRNLTLMIHQDGINSLQLHLLPSTPKDILIPLILLLNNLSYTREEIRDFFEPGGSKKVLSILKETPLSSDNLDLLEILLTFIRCVLKSENNKNSLMKAGLGDYIVDFISKTINDIDIWGSCMEKACLLVRGLCIHDDLRRDMSCAYDNGKYLLKQPNFIANLVSLIKLYKDNVYIASAALIALRSLVTTNESVQAISLYGIIEILYVILSTATNDSSLILIRAAMSLIRNIAADDGKKEIFISMGGLEAVISAMSIENFSQDASLIEHSFGCMAQFTLRSPSNSERLVRSIIAMNRIVEGMRKFPLRDTLQRQACLTIRNIAGRCPELRQQLLDAGVENVLRDAGKLQGVVDEAYSALRDLGCEVQYVKVLEDGTIAPVFEHFGTSGKLNFRPIYDEAGDINNRIVEQARPPLANESHYHNEDYEEDDFCCGDHEHNNHDHNHDHSHAHD